MLQSSTKQILAAVLVTIPLVIAGCSGSTGNNGPGNATTPSRTGNAATPGNISDIAGEVTIAIDELTVVDHQSRLVDTPLANNEWGVVAEIKNTGNKSTDLIMEYSYKLIVYDDSGEEIGVGSTGASTKGEIPPGETRTVTFVPGTGNSVDPGRIGSYEVWVTCDWADDGVYCDRKSRQS